MYAVVAEMIGGPEVITFKEGQPQPQPGKDEVRIQVVAAAINPIDCARRAGYGQRLMSLLGAAKFPLVLGSDFTGVVNAVGPGVKGWHPGDHVFGCKAASCQGTHAQFVTVPTRQMLHLPSSLTPEQAAAIPYSFVTAYRLVTTGLGWSMDDCRSRRVLVHGGLGSVGSFAVNLLSHHGAVVDISDRAPSAEDAVSRRAAEAFDLSRNAPTALAARYDAVLNCARFQDEETLFPLLKPGGRFATIVHPLLAILDEHGWIRGALRARALWRKQWAHLRASGGDSYRWVLFKPDVNAFHWLKRMAGQGLIKPEIAQIVPVREAANAHALMAAGGLRGKLVLQMS
jgi:NADPH:quinone reductase-like Zn-dependent oxidoreductase